MTDDEIEEWVRKDVGLWGVWQATELHLDAFVWLYRREVEQVVETVVGSSITLSELGWDRSDSDG